MNVPLPTLRTRRAGSRRLLLSALTLASGLLLAQSSMPKAAAQWMNDLCSDTDEEALPFSSAASSDAATASAMTSRAASATASATTRPATDVKIISCEPLPNVPGKSITTMMVNFPPLAYSAPHRHPGSVTAIVLNGTVRSQMEGGPVVNYQQGQTWIEAPRALHVLAENPDPVKPAQLLAIFITDGNCGPLVIPEPTSPAAS